jgi:hypothetical protein
MPSIQCKTEIPSLPGLPDNELTVGREFLLICEGEIPKGLQQERISFVLTPEQKYNLKILGFELRSFSEADFKVTSYSAGAVRFDDLQVTDGTTTFSLGPVQWNVVSVLPKQQPGEEKTKLEPFGPIGPANLSIPALYWAIFAAIVGLFVLVFFARIYRAVQRRNMIQRLKEHDSALSPLGQFHQSFRKLQRVNPVFFGGVTDHNQIVDCLKTTNEMYRLFLTRRFQVPAMEWSDRLVLKDLKRYHPLVFSEFSIEMKKIFKEIERGFQDKDTLQEKDVLNIATQVRLLVEKLEKPI